MIKHEIMFEVIRDRVKVKFIIAIGESESISS